MSQTTSHKMPAEPMTTNAPRQVTRMTSVGTSSGTNTLPALVPELKMPAASARSRLGNHSAMVLRQTGKLAASPNPSRNMATASVMTEKAAPGSMAATLHSAMAMAKDLRV